MAPNHKEILPRIDAALDIEKEHAPRMYEADEGRVRNLANYLESHAKRVAGRPKPFQLKVKEPAGIAAAERGR
jgi:hypothetical protein